MYNRLVEPRDDINRFERSVAVIGAGKVGQALALLLRRAGAEIVAVSTRSRESADAAALTTGGKATTDNVEAARGSEVLLLTVGDDDLEKVAQDLADEEGFAEGQLVVHASGVHGLGPLTSAARVGARAACAHPLQSFANVKHAVKEIPGSVFGITASPDALEDTVGLVRAIGGIPVEIAEESKPLYHAAAAMASNHLVALEDLAGEMFVRAGMPEDIVRDALWPLLRGTTANIRRLGMRHSLTGPIVRGDIETVRRHLQAIEDLPGLFGESYRVLAKHATEMALVRGDIDEQVAYEMQRLLAGERTP